MKTSTRRSARPAAPLLVVVAACVVAVAAGGGAARAEPDGSAGACGSADVASPAALASLNALRLGPVVCGAESRPAASPVRWSERLARVARDQAGTMAAQRRMARHAAGERALAARLADVGYPPRIAAENVAFGYPSLEAVVAAWRASPSHCRTLMQPAIVEGGLACVDRDGTRYWALVLGAPADRLREEGGSGPAAGCSQQDAPDAAPAADGRTTGSCP